MKWIKRGFEEFSKGTLGNGGQNIHISAKGVLQRVYQYDINGDGYPDLLFSNSQSMGERPPLYVYDDPLHRQEYFELPSNGTYDGVMADINGDGYQDLIVACQSNGCHKDITSVIFYGSPEGLSERFRVELPVPDSTGVAAGDFNGDGKIDLAFLREDGLRIFYADEHGIEAHRYTDLELYCVALRAADLDGDGYCDLYLKKHDGTAIVLWGGEDGISLDRMTVLRGDSEEQLETCSTTPGMRRAYRGWRPAILNMKGHLWLFRADGNNCYFYSCGKDRQFKKELELSCANAVHAAAGDLDGDGNEDLVIVCFTSMAETQSSYVYWNDGGFKEDNWTAFDTFSVQTVEIAQLDEGLPCIVVCQGGTDVVRYNESFILRFNEKRTPTREAVLKSQDAMRIVTGNTRKNGKQQLVVLNHEMGRHRGDENIYIYLGGPDGYQPDRKLCLPGWSAVDGVMYDFNDDGNVDVLITNCAEDAQLLDPGSFLYVNDGTGVDPERKIAIPTVRGHGAAIGDFRKSGYIDIACGGFRNREIRIFRGGPDGYDVENFQSIVLGPEPEKFELLKGITQPTPEEKPIYDEFGQVRWLFTADFNGDGWLDLFVSQIIGPRCFILWGGPEGYSTERMQVLSTGGAASANAADLDGDGYLDLIIGSHLIPGKSEAGKYEAYVTIYWGGPEGYQEHRKTQLPTFCANAVTVGDFNGDGILDIYASAYQSGRSRDILSFIYYGQPGGRYGIENRQHLFNHSGCGCVAGDFNGDGYTDLAVASHKGYGNHCSESFVFWGGPDGISEDRKTLLPTVGPHGMSSVDPGNIMDRSNEEHYTSEVYSIPVGQRPSRASWTADIPKGCWVKMQLRSADCEQALAETAWSAPVENGESLTELSLSGSLLQYRLSLGSPTACGTPRVTMVEVEFLD